MSPTLSTSAEKDRWDKLAYDEQVGEIAVEFGVSKPAVTLKVRYDIAHYADKVMRNKALLALKPGVMGTILDAQRLLIQYGG